MKDTPLSPVMRTGTVCAAELRVHRLHLCRANPARGTPGGTRWPSQIGRADRGHGQLHTRMHARIDPPLRARGVGREVGGWLGPGYRRSTLSPNDAPSGVRVDTHSHCPGSSAC